MNFWHLIFEIPAAVTASVMVTNILPFSLSPKLNPWIMFLAALAVLFLPLPVQLALAIAIPMGYIYTHSGIRLQGHEPVRIPVEQVRNLVSKVRVPRRTEVKPFLTKEYPDPAKPPVEKYVPDL